ncbi:hypothetical protein JKP88DRAFT_290363 [Tribonema minus]|uniref:Uncharacterized protein n=1 Tax=Tribonema minus TaxID=303371 RepID=A0A835YZ96_9STRA|nr:hypothetical protein JKP88DRAFT_290363 [Tribonema minus]
MPTLEWNIGSELDAKAADFLSVCLIVAGCGTCFFAYKVGRAFVVGIGALLFALFLWNEVVPQFGMGYW